MKNGFVKKAVLMIAALALALVFHSAAAAQQAGQVKNIHIMMGPMGGTLYPVGALMADMISKNFPDVRSNVSPGGSITNIVACDTNKAQMGHTTSEMALAAWQGMEPFKKQHRNIRGLFKIMNMGLQFVIAADSPIQALKEIKEKKYPLKLAVNPRGNVSELMAREILGFYGITYEDIKKWGGRVDFVSHADMGSLYRDRHIEAMVLYTSIPAPVFVESDLARPLKLMPMDQDLKDHLRKKYGLLEHVVPKGTYKGMNQDTALLLGGILILSNKDVPAEQVYRIMKVFFAQDNLKRITGMHAEIKAYLNSLGKAAEGMTIPFHPGAEKFFKEAGVLK
jgi:TRAP transporter TAXI family solute receptor